MSESAILQVEDLERSLEDFRVYTGVLLLSFAKHGQGLRDTIARNFVARGMNCTQSIFSVWKAGSEQDAWILHRSLLDRLFHLRHLSETDSFEAFEEHSFRSIYEARHQLLSDADMRAKVSTELREYQERNRARYDALRARIRWQRPKPEVVAKSMGLGFLYRFGYHYASMHVHPMAGDGESDCEALIAPHQTDRSGDRVVVMNSILVQTMIVQEALNVSTMRWRAIAYKAVEQLRSYLETGDPEFRATLLSIAKVWPAMELCEPAPPRGAA